MNATKTGRTGSDDAPLNPSLKKEVDKSYSKEDQHGTDPMSTISVKKDEGTWWPWIWAGAGIICVIVTLILFL